MGCRSVVTLLVLASAASAADLPTATVTGRRDGEEQTYKDGRATTALGLAVAFFGSAQGEYPATKSGWEAFAETNNYVRVRFAKPATLTADTGGGRGKEYAVDEILIDTTPAAKRPPLATPNGKGYFAPGDQFDPDQVFSLVIRCGDKYYTYTKPSGHIEQTLIALYGPR